MCACHFYVADDNIIARDVVEHSTMVKDDSAIACFTTHCEGP